MGAKNVYERFIWFDHKVKSKKYPNATSLSGQFEISLKTAQRDIEFMGDRLNCPLVYDKSRKGRDLLRITEAFSFYRYFSPSPLSY